MTLIAGFRCDLPEIPSLNSFVVCADSQETITDHEGNQYRVTRQKISPRVCGNFELAIAGYGPVGELIDACVHRLQKRTAREKIVTLSQLDEILSAELRDFYRTEAKLYSKKQRAVDFLVIARSINHLGLQMWQTRASQLVPVDRRILVGWNENLYEHFAQRLYPNEGEYLPPQRAILLGMYLMALAENTSNSVRGPVTVVVAKPNGIKMLSSKRTDNFAEQISLFAAQFDSLILSCADHTAKREEYIAKLDEFRATALQLRDDYIKDAISNVEELMTANDPVRNLPHGVLMTLMGDGSVKICEDPAEVGKFKEENAEHPNTSRGWPDQTHDPLSLLKCL